MRTLVVMRHAKSAWPGDVVDRERPLARRGRRQAPEAGGWIAAHLPLLDLAVVSTAGRAVETWQLIAGQLGDGEPPVRLEERIYQGWDHGLLAVVRELPDDARAVVLVGHNPGVEELVERLTAAPVQMTTSAIAVVRWEGHWDDAGRARAELVAHGRPPR